MTPIHKIASSLSSASFLPSIFSASPIPLPRIRSPPSRPHIPFYKLPSHFIPVKWSLYRRLLQSAPDHIHKQAVRSRWRRPRKQYCTSPNLTRRLLEKEHILLSDYNELRRLQDSTTKLPAVKACEPAATESSQQNGRTVDYDEQPVSASSSSDAADVNPLGTSLQNYHDQPGLSAEASRRLYALQQSLIKFNLDSVISKQVTDNYVSTSSEPMKNRHICRRQLNPFYYSTQA